MTTDYKPGDVLTIDASESLSDAIPLSGRHGVIGFISPVAVTGVGTSPTGDVGLALWGCQTEDGTYLPIFKDNGERATVPVGPAQARNLPLDPVYTAMCKFLKVQVINPTTFQGVPQVAERLFTAVLYEV